ncbi:MAG: phage baseplate assembly protein V [Oceanospirillaceae bacterium]
MSQQLGAMQGLHLGVVSDNQDPQRRGRIQVILHSTGMKLWAPCMTNSAGVGYGISCLPKVEEQVVISFISPEMAIVLGALWSGSDSHPDDAQEVEDKYALITPSGSKIVLDDEQGPKITLQTGSGYRIEIDETGSGEINIEKDNEKIKLSSSGIKIRSTAKVEIEAASTVEVNASMVKVNAAMSDFSGVVKCDTLITNSVVSSSYTPGAGNIW